MMAPRSLHGRRGSSFIEILVALAILAILMIGILQMFSLALITNQGSAARTDLLYKAQQVIENLRLIYFLEHGQAPPTSAARILSGVPAVMAATPDKKPIYLPYENVACDPCLKWAYWGPSGVNVIEAEKLPYRLSYTVEDRDEFFWLVTVTATPVDNPNLLVDGTLDAVTDAGNPRRYRGLGSKLKIVTYAAVIEKWD